MVDAVNFAGIIRRYITFLREFSFIRFIKGQGRCRFGMNANVIIDRYATIKNSVITVLGNSTVTIGKNARLLNANIYVSDGELFVGDDTIIEKTEISLDNSCKFHLGHNCRLSAKRVWIRFGGHLKIGAYTNVNHDSEIRVDERVEIGSYCQISQYVNIWDTNTHSVLPPMERRTLTERYFPFFGFEQERPKTKPVIIGNDCWLGERVTVMKGSVIGNNVIVGYNTMLLDCVIPDGRRVVQDVKLKIM